MFSARLSSLVPVTAAVIGAALVPLVAGTPVRSADQLTPVLARVLATPAAAPMADGRWLLPYELVLTNVSGVPQTIDSLEVLDPARPARPLLSLSGGGVSANLLLPGGAVTTVLGPGQSAVLLVNASFATRAALPERLTHRLTVSSGGVVPDLPPRSVEAVAPVLVDRREPVVLGPPLRGERWVAAASCCDSYHRRSVLPVNGERHVAQRFAIDWIQLEPGNQLAKGDPTLNSSYPQFGREALAVADAIVVHVQDGLPEGTPGHFAPGVTVTNADGNSVVLDLGGGRFALYAHFQPGSLRVGVGDRVRRGQVLALVGNSGNSDAAHLHFHVMDGLSPLASNGLPYVIDRFEVTGRAVSPTDLDAELHTPLKAVQVLPVPGRSLRRQQLPADLQVVRFLP
ncbi:M23 family metallopeptidase [Synechococcus sp. CCY 9618]|uniref:M23 family metallopeptidase n=1 Tax=Synechococcus sp. CCY 9618 TaxID=2815602 RepID=UPI001C243062|nr:M23 family metallopeptidase [Synechococcus sp. CCY 9618]